MTDLKPHNDWEGTKDRMKVQVAHQSCWTLQPHGLSSPWNSPGQNTGMGSLSLLQDTFFLFLFVPRFFFVVVVFNVF